VADSATLIDVQEPPAEPKVVTSPFTVLIDTREQRPYTFEGLTANADQGYAPIVVPTVRGTLQTGDYSIRGLGELVVVERKSKEDLYSSIGQRRENFEQRMRRLCLDHSVAAVVVEAQLDELLMAPPPHSHLHPKALNRTILSWMVRWPRVHWILCPGRAVAEAVTYRFLERFWHAWQGGQWFDAERYAEELAALEARKGEP